MLAVVAAAQARCKLTAGAQFVIMKPKHEKQALVARDLALKLGHYADDQMRIEYRALVNAGPPHEIVVWWTGFKVLNVIWHDDERAVVVSYRGGPWEGWLKRKAAS